MNEEQLGKLRDAVAQLNPKDDAHWNKEGLPNLNVLKEACGFKVERSTLTAYQLDFTREQALAAAEAGAPAEIGAPGPLPKNLPEPDAAPLKAEDLPFQGNVSFLRDLKALRRSKALAGELATILGASTRKSGSVMQFERVLGHFTAELDRALEAANARG